MSKSKLFNTLYWKISAIFLAALVILAGVYIYISVNSATVYYEEVNQRLNAALAEHTVKEISPFVNGEINKEAIQDIMHSMMVINPSVEVYLLDNEGNILTYVAPYKEVKLESVSLQPIEKFIADKGVHYVIGDDPRNPGEQKVFSAAPVIENDQQKGYIYIILASQEYVSAAHALLGSYILRLGTRTMIIALIAAVVIGLIAIWLITRNLNNIIEAVRQFKDGQLKTRISIKSQDELAELSENFNEMAETIEGNIEKLKSMEQLRREFIESISHDLRTPIASIHGYIETMKMKQKEISQEDRDRYIDIVLKNTERLRKSVDDLFELSKLEAKERKLNPEPLPMAELVQDVAGKYRLIAQEKGISINTILSKSLPLVYADIALIDRVLQNIIDNAIKYCKKGDYINIELDQTGQSVLVKIIDTGAGIAKEELPYIFERYHRDHKSSGEKSTGLGLAIVKKILDLHKSTISVISEPNKGTTFSFELPLAQ